MKTEIAADRPLPVTEHLDELRGRIIASLVWYFLISSACYFFVKPVLAWLAKPFGEFIFTAPTEAFFIHLKIAFGMGAVLGIPIALYQAWSFVGVGLRAKERAIVLRVLPASCALFYAGGAVAAFFVVPVACRFLMQFGSPQLRPLISISDYLSFLFWMIIGFGLFFQLPMVIVVLSRFGVIDPRALGGYRRHVFVGIVILAAVATPGPDVFSQLVLAIPTYVLFEISLLIARRVRKKADAEDASSQ